MTSVADWVDRLAALLAEAEADGVRWNYRPDYCYADGCTGCCQSYGPLKASRGSIAQGHYEEATLHGI